MSVLAIPRGRRLAPPVDPRDWALGFLIAVLALLAGGALTAGLAGNRAAQGWTDALAGSATVVVRASGVEDGDAAVARAAEALADVRGVAEARALEREQALALLRPWLDVEALPADLPTPRLVTVELDRAAPARPEALTKALAEAGVDATVDDHRQWLAESVRAGAVLRAAATLLLGLTLLATLAGAALAARAGLQAHREFAQTLSISGAEDGWIAGLFGRRYAGLAGACGLLGAAAAALLLSLAKLAFGLSVLHWGDLLAVLVAPPGAAAAAALAADQSVRALLREWG